MKTLCKITLLSASLLFVNNVFAQQTEREKGIELYQSGDYKAAIEILQKAVETDENDAEAWRFLGMAFAKTGDKKQARKVFDKADDFRDEDLNKNYDTPVEMISRRFPRYTDVARQNNVSGRVKLAVEFGKDGQIGYIFPVRELPDGLTESAVKAASSIKFKSAVRNGKAVTVIKFVEYSFTIY